MVATWLELLTAFQGERRCPPGSTVNYNECRLVTEGNYMIVLRVQAAIHERASVSSTCGASFASLSAFVRVDGAALLSM